MSEYFDACDERHDAFEPKVDPLDPFGPPSACPRDDIPDLGDLPREELTSSTADEIMQLQLDRRRLLKRIDELEEIIGRVRNLDPTLFED